MVANGAPSYYSVPGVRPVLGFFSNRVLRGGPRVLLNLAAFLVLLILVMKFAPQHMSQISFGHAYDSIWRGAGRPAQEAAPEAGKGAKGATVVDDGPGGGLRIVVFGENDIGTPWSGGRDEEKSGPAWTEALCDELNCSSYISLVPSTSSGWSLSSNGLYASTVDKVLSLTEDSMQPGLDYSYLLKHYPAQWDVADLKMQVTAFLASEKPSRPPRETLWVLSFGTWDVWSLASLPSEVSKPVLEDMAADIFSNVERLYQASLDPESIAYSNHSLEDGGAQPSSAAADAVDSFRVFIPKLFDPSMTPGWDNLRPELPRVHSRAEQMRNAAELTSDWNMHVYTRLMDWVRTPDPAEEGSEESASENRDEAADGGNAEMSSHKETRDDEGKQRRDGAFYFDAATPSSADDDAAPSSTPTAAPKRRFPQRDGLVHDGPSYLLDLIADRQMRAAWVKDAKGFGERPLNTTFREVRAPCVPARDPVPHESAVRGDDVIANKMTEAEWNKIPKDKKKHLMHGKRGEEGQGEEKGEGEGEKSAKGNKTDKAGGDGGEPRAVCDDPEQHLFHTPLTLSSRAIREVARQCAEMVRKNDSLRGRWAAAQEAKSHGGRSWTG
ncbi:hypothetical protein NKR23_g4307 [Pleurostoma richardsiae]|uniref:Uncharacterized protein n=1 Tax=Pleurostoma richardsiae TaxID=41990 RepID=A0AA38RIN8_9PEZI|nr:hypothetical protein NKR23_g4307 [Pleurostoma richardsiae]